MQIFKQYDADVFLLPTTFTTAPFIEEASKDAVAISRLYTRFTAPFNLTGLPAVTIPCGFSSQGLPIGLELVARPWDDGVLLATAAYFQSATDWHQHHPDSDKVIKSYSNFA